jgi:hypothetical protein
MNDTIPLALLAIEWETSAEALIADLSPDRVLVDVGVRYVRRSDALELLERRNAEVRVRAGAEAAHRERIAALQRPVLERVQAIQAQQRQMRADGDIGSDTPALVAMAMGDTSDRLTAASERMDELLGAAKRGDYGTMHRYTPEKG